VAKGYPHQPPSIYAFRAQLVSSKKLNIDNKMFAVAVSPATIPSRKLPRDIYEESRTLTSAFARARRKHGAEPGMERPLFPESPAGIRPTSTGQS
jgi:hypothetical protein